MAMSGSLQSGSAAPPGSMPVCLASGSMKTPRHLSPPQNRCEASSSSAPHVSHLAIPSPAKDLRPSAALEANQDEEQVDEVQVEGERAHDRVRTPPLLGQSRRHVLQPLGVPRRQSGEDDDADDGDEELERIVVPEQAEDRRQHQPDQAHEEELPGADETALRRPA